MATDRSVTVVGGGIHGVHLAVRLLEEGAVDHGGLRIVEPNGLLSSFRRKCRVCGMEKLRSPFVHHLGLDPFSLRDFAREHGREDELVPSQNGGDRPTLSLFSDHADRLCEEYGLESVRLDSAVTDLSDTGTGVLVETTEGSFRSRWSVLAVGNGGSYRTPDWAADLPESAPVSHVWDSSFDPSGIGELDRVAVVGSGVTGVQLATSVAQPGREVVLFARSPFRVNRREADDEWMHFSNVVDELHSLPPASPERELMVMDARHDGAVPPYAMDRLRRVFDRGLATLKQTEIIEATEAGGTVVVSCRDGTAAWFDTVVCATGFGSPYDGTLVSQLREDGSFATGYRGAPVLDDDSLRWIRNDGTPSRTVLSGAVARQVLGPFGRNIVGARRAGNLLLDALEKDRAEPAVP